MRNFTFFSAEIMLLHPPAMTLGTQDNLCGHETLRVTNSWNTFAWQWKPCHEPRDTLHHNINTDMSWISSQHMGRIQTVHDEVVWPNIQTLYFLLYINPDCFESQRPGCGRCNGVVDKCHSQPLSGYKCGRYISLLARWPSTGPCLQSPPGRMPLLPLVRSQVK